MSRIQPNTSTPSMQTKNESENQHELVNLKLSPLLGDMTSTQILEEIYKIMNEDKNKKQSNSEGASHHSQNPVLTLNSAKSEGSENTMKCKCKKTKCLKLYCECFALGEYCKDCNCIDCRNTQQYDQIRAQAIDEALNRDPNSFHSKVKQLKGGCICKKTGCIKKYCQCYHSGKKCTDSCKCMNCGNKEEQCIRFPQSPFKEPLAVYQGNFNLLKEEY